jgi:malonyl-CoA/methylmalonyl-CoA synthetase
MRLFISGSAPLAEQTSTQFQDRIGHDILERYGMSETLMIASNPLEGSRLPGTVGYALPDVHIRIRNEEGELAPINAVGEIEVQGPNVMLEYWQMPEKTAAEFTTDGYLKTGDVGLLDETGRLSLVGRSKDLIISRGYNVYPKEIEVVLDALPGVVDSAVVGVPHPDFGEGVVAVLVSDEPIDVAKIKAVLSNSLARFKQPKQYFQVSDLPRNAMGIVQKAVLREAYADVFK